MPLHRTVQHALSEFSVRHNNSASVSANIGALACNLELAKLFISVFHIDTFAG